MPYHEWNDSWFEKYGDDLNAAIDFIQEECRRRGGMHVHMKEKYGSIRFEYEHMYFWPTSWPIYNYFYPGYMWYRWPKWMRKVERFTEKMLYKSGIAQRSHRKQNEIFMGVIADTVAKWPHITKEIVADVNFRGEDDE